MKSLSRICISLLAVAAGWGVSSQAQSLKWAESTDADLWARSSVKMSSKPSSAVIASADDATEGHAFSHLGTTFNELDWDAFLMLTRDEQDELMRRLFAPDGELKFTRGRVSMNCNDYGREWYSCDEVAGDLELRYFNIERDKRGIIPLIRAAQKYNPDLTFWISPWSPPSWMKINHDYPVVSSRHNNGDPRIDYLLFGSVDDIDEDEMKFLGERDGKFPRRLATQDYFIQDPRYLQAYANYFCKFIDAYAEQGVPVDMVIYQNEAYSYTPYPGCAWTAEGTVRFNRDYLGPTLKKQHPEVKLYLGTFNTNRVDYVQKIASDKGLQEYVSGMAFQWEGRESLPVLREEHPDWSYMCSESECGWGSFDWGAGEHTFELMNHYLGNGCNEYTFWNTILADKGESPWGWKQNALIQVDSKTRKFTYTPEYYAVKHYCHFIRSGARIVGYKALGEDKMPVLVSRTSQGKYVVIAGNFKDETSRLTVGIAGKTLSVDLAAHSYNTFVMK